MNLYNSKWLSWLFWRLFLRNPKLRLRLTTLFVRAEEKTVEIAGSKVCINSVSEIGYARAAAQLKANIVSRDELGSLINLALILEPGDTFIDVGANVGLHSSILGRIQYLFPRLPCYAFEANPDTAVRLRKTLADKSTSIECIALSDKEGTMRFARGAVSGVFGSLDDASDFQDKSWTVDLPVRRLDSFDIVGDSLVLKIDVEGHEWQVLQGALALFQAKRIKAVYLDGFRDARIPDFLRQQEFSAYDGRSLEHPPAQQFSFLFLHDGWVEKSSQVHERRLPAFAGSTISSGMKSR